MTKEKITRRVDFVQYLKNFFENLKRELTTGSKFYWYQVLASIVISCLIVASFFSIKFAYVAIFLIIIGVVACFFVGNNSLFGLSFLLYFLSFSNVIILPNISISMYSLAVSLFVICACIKWLIQIIKKEKKFELKIFVPFALLIFYLTLLFILKFYSFTFLTSVIVGVLLLFVIAVFRQEINFKEVAFSLVIGLLVSCFIGLFYEFYPNLKSFYNFTYALGTFRYSALFPNTNAFSFCVLFVLACVGCLYISKKINILYYPIALSLLVVSFSTISKMVILMVVIILPLTWLLRFIYDKGWKKKLTVTISMIMLIVLSVAIKYDNFKTMVDRLEVTTPVVETPNTQQPTETPGGEMIEPPDQVIPEIPSTEHEDKNGSLGGDNKENNVVEGNGNEGHDNTEEQLNEFLTGRLDLWKNSLKSIFENPTSMLFGHRLGSDYNMGDGNYQLGSPHNTYLQCIYHVGIIGFGLICMSLLSLVDIKSLKNFAKSGILLVVVIVLMFGTLDNFSYMGFMYLSMVVLSLTGQQIKYHGEEKNDT